MLTPATMIEEYESRRSQVAGQIATIRQRLEAMEATEQQLIGALGALRQLQEANKNVGSSDPTPGVPTDSA